MLKPTAMKMRLAVLCAFLGGCSLYWPGGGDDVCNAPTGGALAQSEESVINPDTGTCESFSGGGGGGCDNACGPCYESPPVQPPADWAQCSSGCNGLDQTSCEAAGGCHAFFIDQSAIDGGTSYWECEAVAPNGPIETACDGLGSQDCSDHDNCISIYASDGSTTTFESCAAENPTTCGADGTCAAGSHCAEQCSLCEAGNGTDPKTPCGNCSAVCVPDQVCGEDLSCPTGYDCTQVCAMQSDGSTTCSNLCVPNGSDPGTCTSTGPMCSMAPPECPVNTVPGILDGCWSGYCIPTADCGPGDPGTCTSSGPMCAMAPPACPPNTTPGILDGCWSGYCIPDAACPTPDCTTLTTQAACDARSDCASVFTGVNCTCDESGNCTCESETFARCESAGGM